MRLRLSRWVKLGSKIPSIAALIPGLRHGPPHHSSRDTHCELFLYTSRPTALILPIPFYKPSHPLFHRRQRPMAIAYSRIQIAHVRKVLLGAPYLHCPFASHFFCDYIAFPTGNIGKKRNLPYPISPACRYQSPWTYRLSRQTPKQPFHLFNSQACRITLQFAE